MLANARYISPTVYSRNKYYYNTLVYFHVFSNHFLDDGLHGEDFKNLSLKLPVYNRTSHSPCFWNSDILSDDSLSKFENLLKFNIRR